MRPLDVVRHSSRTRPLQARHGDKKFGGSKRGEHLEILLEQLWNPIVVVYLVILCDFVLPVLVVPAVHQAHQGWTFET